MVECLIHKKDKAKRLWEKSGINMVNQNMTFANFKEYGETAHNMKSTAMKYAAKFDEIEHTDHNSLALLGQSGSGKTHLCIAVANSLINQQAVEVRYFQFREAVTVLKQCNNNENAVMYQDLINKYKKTQLLMIDDLFKDGTTEADRRVMFEIINYRSVNKLPMIVSSEMFDYELRSIDDAIGSRILYSCEDYRFQVERREENNYRVRGMENE